MCYYLAMIVPDTNASIILDSIHSWKLSGEKLVVGIDGYSGSGKTTLLNQLASLDSDILTISRDAFAIPRDDFIKLFQKASSETEKVSLLVEQTINVNELVDFIKDYKSTNDARTYTLRGTVSGARDDTKTFDFSKPVLVIEGIFLFHHKEPFDLFDKKVYVDIDMEVADERRRAREKAKWGAEYFPDTHPDSFSRLIKIGFMDYFKNERPDLKTDLVLPSNIKIEN